MAGSKDLFVLIRSLDKNEKRYFRLFASLQAGEKNYLKLFDAIDLQKEYDEVEIIRKFQHEKFTKRFPVTKSYLYGLVLRSLRLYHENHSVGFEIKSLLNNAHILVSKGLFQQAIKNIASAKNLIQKHERRDFQYEAISLQRTIMNAHNFQQNSLEDIHKMHAELKKDLLQLLTSNDYELLSNKLYKFNSQQAFLRDKKQKQLVENIMSDPLLKDESLATNLKSKQIFYAMHSNYHLMSGNLHKRYYYYGKLVNLYRQHSDLVAENPKRILLSLHKFIASCVRLRKYAEAEKAIAELKTLSSVALYGKNMQLKSLIFNYSVNLEQDMFLQRGQFGKGVSNIAYFEEGVKLYGKQIGPHPLMIVHFNICCLYFGARKYEEAKVQMNKMMYDPELHLKKDLYCVARILNLLIYYELGDFDVLEYTLRSTYQLLGRQEKLFRSEKLTLNFIRKFLSSKPDKITLKSMFRKMAGEIEEIERDPYEKALLEYFDLISWVESKIRGCTFEEIIKEKEKKWKDS